MDAYRKDIFVHNYSDLVEAAGMNDKVAAPTEEDNANNHLNTGLSL